MIISNDKCMVTRKSGKNSNSFMNITLLSLGLIDIFLISSQKVTKLLIKLFIQVQFFKFS